MERIGRRVIQQRLTCHARVEHDENLEMEKVMKVLDKELLAQLVGGKAEVIPGETIPGGGGGGGGGGAGGGGGGGDGGGGSVAFNGTPYDIYAVGVEGGQEAVVRISGANPIFNGQVGSDSASPWLEQHYQGMFVSDKGVTAEHEEVDDILKDAVNLAAGGAGGAFIYGALRGAGVGMMTAGPWAALGGIVIGGFAAYGAYFLLERDHVREQGEIKKGYIDRNGVPRQVPATSPVDPGDAALSYAARQGSNVMQMMA